MTASALLCPMATIPGAFYRIAAISTSGPRRYPLPRQSTAWAHDRFPLADDDPPTDGDIIKCLSHRGNSQTHQFCFLSPHPVCGGRPMHLLRNANSSHARTSCRLPDIHAKLRQQVSFRFSFQMPCVSSTERASFPEQRIVFPFRQKSVSPSAAW